jgi:hypothetical protein
MIKNTTKTYHEDGWCESLKTFKKYWSKLPHAQCTIIIRNFNKVAGRITILIKTPPGIGEGKLYYHEANLADFFSEDLVRFLKEEEQRSRALSAKFLVKIGDIIAKAIGRELIIVHQEGGDPDTAAFTEYAFSPNKFVAFDFDPKETWGFLFSENDFEEVDLFANE